MSDHEAHPSDPWTILDKDRHTGLWDNRQVIASRAGLPVEWLWSDARKWLPSDEYEFCTDYGAHLSAGRYGIVYVGHPDGFTPSVLNRCRAMAARFVRGAKGGLCFTLGQHLDRFTKLGITGAGLLALPDFAMHPPDLIPAEQKRAVLEQMMGRIAKKKGVSVLGVLSWDRAEKTYGEALTADLKSKFIVIEGNAA